VEGNICGHCQRNVREHLLTVLGRSRPCRPQGSQHQMTQPNPAPHRPSASLRGQIREAWTLEPGDLVLGPDVGPGRIWWTLRPDGPARLTHVALLLNGPAGPYQQLLPRTDVVLSTDRGTFGSAPDAQDRLFAAACGATWLRQTEHPDRPTARGVDLLVTSYARLVTDAPEQVRQRIDSLTAGGAGSRHH
jgi:hypothetical protein